MAKLIKSPVEKIGGGGNWLKMGKDWWKFEILGKFTRSSYRSTDSCYFKSQSKSKNYIRRMFD